MLGRHITSGAEELEHTRLTILPLWTKRLNYHSEAPYFITKTAVWFIKGFMEAETVKYSANGRVSSEARMILRNV